MSPYAAFHLGLHCLPKYHFTGIQNEKGYAVVIEIKKSLIGIRKSTCTCIYIYNVYVTEINIINIEKRIFTYK